MCHTQTYIRKLQVSTKKRTYTFKYTPQHRNFISISIQFLCELQSAVMANWQPHVTGPANQTGGIVGPEYCAPYNVDLAVVRKVMTLADSFNVTDVNGKTVFKLKGSLMTLHDHRVLLDATGKPIVTLRRKVCL